MIRRFIILFTVKEKSRVDEILLIFIYTNLSNLLSFG
jgi:hypothetical protein